MDPELAAQIEIDSKATAIFMGMGGIPTFDRSMSESYNLWENCWKYVLKYDYFVNILCN